MSADITDLGAVRTSRPAKVPLAAPFRATLTELKQAVRWRSDAPTEVPEQRMAEIVGVTALHLGLCSLGRTLELDLGNGYVLTCSVKEAEAACAG